MTKLNYISEIKTIEENFVKCFRYEMATLYISLFFLIISLFFYVFILLVIFFIALSLGWKIEKRYWSIKLILIKGGNNGRK